MHTMNFNPMALPLRKTGLFLLSLLWVFTVASQPQPNASLWPSKPVKLLVGFPGGSSPDIMARALAEPLSKALSQAVVVENRIGASGNISADVVAKAMDDHTLGLVINGNLTSAKMLDPKLPYDPAHDFYFISLLGTAPLLMVAPVSLPDGLEFIGAAKKNASQWNYASVGVGSVAHLGMELFKSKVPGVDAVHVPYPGNPQVITAMLSGQIQIALMAPSVVMAQIKAGKLKAIGLTSQRSDLVPGIASLSEFGVKDYKLEVWNALVAPANLSSPAKIRLAHEIAQIFAQEDFRQKLFNLGWQPVGSNAEQLKNRVNEESQQWGQIIQQRHIRLD
jgi:tripartite-type tricarboxylate transporter receptor subunit TctC